MLPGRDGSFSRAACNRQMEADSDATGEAAAESIDDDLKIIRFCRRCELSCPVGTPLRQEDNFFAT
jgi:epoxyqueuosine reductase